MAARRHGYSLENHESSQLSGELIDWADWVFAMTPSHLHQVHLLGGKGKSELLVGYAAGADGFDAETDERSPSVPDPFGGDDQVYEDTFLVLENYVQAVIRRLMEEQAG